MRSLPLLALALTACAGAEYGSGDVSGAIGSATFGDDVSVYHGTRHIVIVDRRIDCIDMGWVERNYFVEPVSSSVEFAAVQFTFDADTPEEGTFSAVAGEGAATAWRLLNLDLPTEGAEPPIDFDRGREGTITISDIGDAADDEDPISGEFAAVFADGNVQGTFTSAHCRNLR